MAPKRDPEQMDAPSEHTIVILGAGGDLTERFLLPGIGHVAASSPGVRLHLIGAARTAKSTEAWRMLVARSLLAAGVDAATSDALVELADFVQTDASSPRQLAALLEACPSAPLLYLALPPAMVAGVVAALGEIELPDSLRIAVEKPFGEDLADARALNEALRALIPEERIWRIDHFLATPTALELLRGGDLLQDASTERVARVDLVFEEALGIEGRGAFYDATGALRDMLQSHLMLLLALVAMDGPGEPGSPRERTSHERMAEVLRRTSLWSDGSGRPMSFRARYSAGEAGGRSLPAYVDEEDVDPRRGTETFAQITLRVDLPRWAGVPFTLRSGKAIDAARQELVLTWRDTRRAPTRIPLRAPEGDPSLDPYARVVAGLLSGSQLLSVRGDLAEECWRIVEPVLHMWAAEPGGVPEYSAGRARGLPD